MSSMLLIHIVGGAIGLLTGTVALIVSKGGVAHQRFGAAFVYSMLALALSGALIAALTDVKTSTIAGLLTAYLVTTAWTTVTRGSTTVAYVNRSAIVVGIGVGAYSYALGIFSLLTGTVLDGGMPVTMLFIFGTVAIASAAADIRLVYRPTLKGRSRLVRHLWRMCFALFIASGSFFLGQSDEIPEDLRIFPLLLLLALAPLVVMVYWVIRMARGRRSGTLPRVVTREPIGP